MSSSSRGRSSPPIEYSLLLTATLCLLALGALMVFSASSARSVLDGGGDGFYYLKRTVIFAVLGLAVMHVASKRGVAIVRPLIPVLLAISLILLLAVLIPGIGQGANGAQRWIGAGTLQFQPSELAKLALVLYGADLLATKPRRARDLHGLGPFLIVVAISAILIAREPDLGTSLVIAMAVCSVLFTAGVRPRTLAPVGAVIAIAGIVMIATHPYQQERLAGFLNPSADASGAGFQGKQASIALGSGGLFGVGLGESVQKAFYLPEAHTDMIVAVYGEETGLVGMIVLIGLFGMFGYAGFRAAHRARDRFSKLLAAGLTSLVLAQAALNLFAVLGLAPLTGVPLPFVSYGGTSLVVTLASAGLILNVARRSAKAGSRASGRSSSQARPRGERTAAGGAARLSVLEGGSHAGQNRRKRAGRNTSRDSGRRHGGTRRAGDRRRRRAAR